MKVLHIEAGKHLYGGANQVACLIPELAKFGVNNVLVCTKGSEIEQHEVDDCQVFSVKMGGEIDPFTFFRLRTLIKKLAPDLVHVHSRRGADIWGLLAAKNCKIPVVCSRRVDNPEPVWLSKFKYNKFDKVIAISEGIRRVLLQQSIDPNHVFTVHSGVDTDVFKPQPDTAWFKNEFGLDDTNLVIANFAQMIERKGQRLLIQAIHQLVPHYPNLRLLLFGKGPKLAEYQELVEELGLENHIQFPGFRSDLTRVLPNVDIVAHPAYAEGLGVALLQSSACAIPIVAGAAGGIPEVVQDGENGFLFEPGNLDELKDCLEKLINQKDLRDQFAENGRKAMVEKFSTTAMARGNLAVYEELLQ